MARKRAPGGGRKPKQPRERKAFQLQLRIDSDLRAVLKAEGATRGGMSKVALSWLKAGLKAKRDRAQDDPMRALCYVIAEIAPTICNFKVAAGKPALDWRTNPFAFEALKLTIIKFMDAIKPKGKIRSPAKDHPVLKNAKNPWGPHGTPQSRADHVAKIILSNFYNAKDMDVQEMFGPGLSDEAKADLQHTVYGMNDARKDLLGQ